MIKGLDVHFLALLPRPPAFDVFEGRVHAVDLDRLASSALESFAGKNGRLKQEVTRSLKSPALAPSAPTLLSGSTR